MKNVRVWFKKSDEAAYISHLDLNRTMLRAVAASEIDVWYTEGFNPHPFITFALPLSLGITSFRESMDMRLISDVETKNIIERLNKYLPESIKVFDVSEPVMKSKDIAAAEFKIRFDENVSNDLTTFLNQEHIITDKKTKSGVKQVDIKQKIIAYDVLKEQEGCSLLLKLPAGNVENIKPALLLESFKTYLGREIFFEVTKINLYNDKMEVWK